MDIVRSLIFQLRWAGQSILARLAKVSPAERLLHPYPRISQTRSRHSPRRINDVLRVLAHSASYLEVGIEKGWTLQSVRAKRRVDVDPRPRFSTEFLPPGVEVFEGTSDDFFAVNEDEFGLIFLDGLHEAIQTYMDFCNATKVLSTGGGNFD